MGGKAHGGRRIPLAEALRIGAEVMDWAMCEGAVLAMQVGSVRRMRPEVGDVDIAILIGAETRFDDACRSFFGQLKNGNPQRSGLWRQTGVQVDLFTTLDIEAWGALTLHATGSVGYNVETRARAKRLGLILNEKGLWRKSLNEVVIPGGLRCKRLEGVPDPRGAKPAFDRVEDTRDEMGICVALGLPWTRPEDRER